MKGLELLTIFSALLGFVAADGGRASLAELHQSRCIGKDGVFLPIPGTCTHYIICVKGIAVLSTCGEYHFDARRSICDLPGKAGCISFGPETLPSPVGNICLGHMDGDKLSVPGKSSNFLECLQETAFLKSCGSLQFDEKTKQCVGVNEQPLPKPEVAPCFSVADGVKLPVPNNPRQYYFCINNKAFLKDCGNMYFIAKHGACSISSEQEQMIPPSPPTNSPETLPPQQLPNHFDPLAQKICQNQRLGARVAVPGTCFQYYVCMGNTGILKNCGLMQFNPITSSCDLSSNVRCSVHATGVDYGKQDSLPHPTSKNSTSDQICYGQRDGIFLAAPGKCSDFYLCFRNKGYLKNCGDRHFNPITLSCVPLEESNCMEIAPAIQMPVVATNNCLSRDNGALLRHPTECGKYLICDNHVAVEMLCPAGLHFNSERNYCDWPEMAKCF